MLKMNGKCYEGKKLTFYKDEEPLGTGGNGSVYCITPVKGDPGIPLVAKFLNKKSEKNLQRFRREIQTMIDAPENGIDGIIPIIDIHCPETVSEQEEIWYVMPKAKSINVKNNKRDFITILKEMLLLARTIEALHTQKDQIAHRDIKPGNILRYQDRLMLSDFGMVWTLNGDNITRNDERIGPYRIMPPEFEPLDEERDFNYTPSDVYLFAKVLWMMIRKDNNGFRGQYNRKDVQIYLDHEKMKIQTPTLEPIHRLLEEATAEIMDDRITISQCIEYIEEQIGILQEERPSDNTKRQCYKENIHRIEACTEPKEIVVDDFQVVYMILEKMVPVSVTYVKTRRDKLHPFYASDCRLTDDALELIQFREDGPIIIRLKVKKLTIDMKDDTIRIEIQKPDANQGETISWDIYCREPYNRNKVIVLEETEELLICNDEDIVIPNL